LADLFSILTHLLPHSYDIWLGLGLAYQKVSQNLESVVPFEQAKNLCPDLFLTSLYQAENYLGLKQFSESKKCVLEAFQLMGSGDRNCRKYTQPI
jgi:tetratricopeptide (TPR) repeat protein